MRRREETYDSVNTVVELTTSPAPSISANALSSRLSMAWSTRKGEATAAVAPVSASITDSAIRDRISSCYPKVCDGEASLTR